MHVCPAVAGCSKVEQAISLASSEFQECIVKILQQHPEMTAARMLMGYPVIDPFLQVLEMTQTCIYVYTDIVRTKVYIHLICKLNSKSPFKLYW